MANSDQFSDGLQGQEWTQMDAPLVPAFGPKVNEGPGIGS